MDGCLFSTDDQADAMEHFKEGLGHELVEIELTSNQIVCFRYLEQSQIRDFDD